MTLPPDLEDRVRQGKVIPFAGAGVSMAVRSLGGEEPLFPSWNELLQRAADMLDRNGKADDAMIVRGLLGKGSDPCLIAEHARAGLKLQWNDFLKDAFEVSRSQLDDRTLDLPRLLWRLGSGLVVTTNYDAVLKWACPDEWNADLDVLGLSAPAELSRLVSGRGRKPTLWHLHGHIGNATDIILTPDGYERLYANDHALLSRHEDALASLKGLLLSHTFLFVGFSFRDPYFGGQLNWLRRVFDGASPQQYCLVPADEAAHLRELDLPVEPIVYEGHGEPLLASLRRISELAAKRPTKSLQAGSRGERFAQPTFPRHSLPSEVTARSARHIVGRTIDFGRVKQLLLSRESPIYPVYGQPGVGKTALALELAADLEVIQHYDRGIFWVDVGPTPHLDADLDGLGEQLGISRGEIQQYATVEQKGERIRREIGKGRALIVLDNVWTDMAVRAFLVGGSESAHRGERPDPGWIGNRPRDPGQASRGRAARGPRRCGRESRRICRGRTAARRRSALGRRSAAAGAVGPRLPPARLGGHNPWALCRRGRALSEGAGDRSRPAHRDPRGQGACEPAAGLPR